MNSRLIENWNKVVTPTDTIFFLGDLILSNNKKQVKDILDSLHGKIIFIVGDHDGSVIQLYPERFEAIYHFHQINPLPKLPTISLMHYCMRVWPKSHFNSWHCYSHSHGKLPSIGKSHDVGVDNNNFTPISLDEIEEMMKLKEDNFNLVKGKKQKENMLPQLELEFTW